MLTCSHASICPLRGCKTAGDHGNSSPELAGVTLAAREHGSPVNTGAPPNEGVEVAEDGERSRPRGSPGLLNVLRANAAPSQEEEEEQEEERRGRDSSFHKRIQA